MSKTIHDHFGPAENAREQLRRWDAGETIWTIEMGGMGPGYEQCIQILAIEIVRDELGKPLPAKDDHKWADGTVDRINRQIGGFSGAQVGAAKQLAYQWLSVGPVAVQKKAPVDRHIQASKHWPHVSDPEIDSEQGLRR